MYDRNTGNLRSGILEPDTYHYSEMGIRILAKEIKRSLHSRNHLATRVNITNKIDPPMNTSVSRTIPTSVTQNLPTNSNQGSNLTNPIDLTRESKEPKQLLYQLLQGMSQLITNVQGNLA